MLAGETEQKVFERARDGDREAVKQLYDSYSKYVTAVCARFVPDPLELGDVVQDSFVKIFTSLDRFNYRGEGSLKAWVRQIAVNEALKCLRNNRKLKSVIIKGELPEKEVEEDLDEDARSVPLDALQGMVMDLPDGYRTVFNLYALEDRSHRDIAKLLGISESTSASQLFRARQILAQKIKEYKEKKRII